MAFSFDAVSPLAVAYVGVLTVLFVILAFICQRKTWLWVGMTGICAMAVAFLAVPSYIVKLQTAKEPDSMDVLGARTYGISILSACLPWFLLHNTRDATVHITLMMSFVVSSSIEVMAQLFSFFTSGKKSDDTQTSSIWNDQYLLLFGLPTVLWMLGNLVQLLRSHDFNTYPQHNIRLNNHLRVDAWLCLLLALVLLAFPRQHYSLNMPGAAPPSEVMLHFFRCKGAMLVGEAVTSLQAPGFLHSRDKRALFSSRLIIGALVTALYIIGAFVFNIIPHKLYHGVIILVVLMNALIARFTDATTIYVVPTPSKRKDKGAATSDLSPTSERTKSD